MKRHSGSIFEQSHHMFDCYTHNLSHYEIYIRITTPGAFVIMKVKSNKAIYNMGAVYIQPFPSTNMPLIKSRNFWFGVNICCSVPFLLQLFHVLNNFLDPSVTRFLLNFMFSLSLLLSTSPALWWKRRGFKILSSPWSSRKWLLWKKWPNDTVHHTK